MSDDDYDLSSEIAEERQERYFHNCAMRDMDQGIRPTYWDEPEELTPVNLMVDEFNARPKHAWLLEGGKNE
jgi:hypothetical protein